MENVVGDCDPGGDSGFRNSHFYLGVLQRREEPSLQMILARRHGLDNWASIHRMPRVTGRAISNSFLTVSEARSSRQTVPRHLRREVATVLITEDQIARRIRSLAREIQRDYAAGELVIVSLLNGTVLFLADLIRHLPLPLRLDFMGVSSYGSGTESGDLVFTKELRLDVRGRNVLLVDDILDTGRTIKRVLEKLHQLKPRRIRTCVLLDKPARRVEKVRADYVGFRIPDLFVVGYGLDYAERYRNLPFVGVLKPEMYRLDQAR